MIKKHKAGVKQVEESEEPEAEALSTSNQGSYLLVCVDGVDVCMELDTGASVSIVSETQYKQLWPGRSLDTSLGNQ